MARTPITQRQLRNESGAIMRRLDAGEEFLVTRNGVPVGELSPVRRRRFLPVDLAKEALAGAPSVDARRLRADLDAVVDQTAAPHG